MCKLRDDTMSKAGELPMEKKVEDQGMFRPLKNLSAAEVAPQGAAVCGETAALPDGWKIGNACNGKISVTKDGVGGYSAQRDDDNIASSILYKLACSLRYAAVSPRAADVPSEPSELIKPPAGLDTREQLIWMMGRSSSDDLLEVARTLCSIAARRQELTDSQRANYPHVDEEGSPVLCAARAACVARGYTKDGLSVEGVVYPLATNASSEPSELVKELRECAGNSGYSHNDYADTMRRAADALDNRAPAAPAASVAPDADRAAKELKAAEWRNVAAYLEGQQGLPPDEMKTVRLCATVVRKVAQSQLFDFTAPQQEGSETGNADQT